MLTLVPELGDDDVTGEIEKVSGYLTNQQGTIKETLTDSPWGRRRLAYTIRHNGTDYRDAYYTVIHFDLTPSNMVEVERDLKLNTNIMRYILVHDDPKMGEPEPRMQEATAEAEQEPAAEDSPAPESEDAAEQAIDASDAEPQPTEATTGTTAEEQAAEVAEASEPAESAAQDAAVAEEASAPAEAPEGPAESAAEDAPEAPAEDSPAPADAPPAEETESTEDEEKA